MTHSLYHGRGDDTPRDAGVVGIRHEVATLPEFDAGRQWEELRAAPPEIQAAAFVRYRALRERLFEGRTA